MKTLVQSWRQLRLILEMIKFEHTLFALPFALMSMLLAADGFPAGSTVGWILVAMVGARSCAMAFNRLVDQEFDRLNPRTADRALPAGRLTRSQVWIFTVVAGGLLVLAAGKLNRLALALSPVALVVICGYSFTKRFTDWSHLVLGLALAIAPVGAWIAVRGEFSLPALILAAAVVLWVAGFDIIYACQDVDFDRQVGLHSLPQRWGIAPALWFSRLLHLAMVGLLGTLFFVARLHLPYLIGVMVVAGLLAYEQSLVKPHDLSRVNAAFFTTNGFVSVGLLVFTAIDVWTG